MARKKSWREKLSNDKGLPKVETITGKLSKRLGTGTVVIPAPSEVDAAMKKVRRGKLTTIELKAKAGLTGESDAANGCSHSAPVQLRSAGAPEISRVMPTAPFINLPLPWRQPNQTQMVPRQSKTDCNTHPKLPLDTL